VRRVFEIGLEFVVVIHIRLPVARQIVAASLLASGEFWVSVLW
jgi:hypothetical protein